MVIRFYDKQTFALKGEFAKFVQTTQTKYINAVGTFEIVTDYIPDQIQLEDIIYVTGTDCETYCGEITQIAGSLTAEGEKYTFKGRDIIGFLSERMPIYNGAAISVSSLSRESVLTQIQTRSYRFSFSDSDGDDWDAREIAQIVFASNQKRGETISYTCDPQTSALDNMYVVATGAQWGLELQPDFSNKQYVTQVIVPERKADVVLSPKFDNLINEQFVASVSSHKNVAYYSWTENDVTKYGNVQLNAGTGWGRKERWISASTGEDTTEDAARATIKMQLGNYKTVESYTGDYQESKTFAFGVDFQLGDIITYSGKLGTAEAQVIGYTQTHGEGQYTMQLLFGDNISDTVRNIQKIERGK